MRTLGVTLLVVATALLSACGGSTKTVTVTGSGSGSTTPSTGGRTGTAVNCFKAGGAAVRIGPAGRGSAVLAYTHDKGKLGVLIAPNAQVAGQIATAFAAGGRWKPKAIKGDPLAFAMYQAPLTSTDKALLSKCAR